MQGSVPAVRFFEPRRGVRKRAGNLPHWYQPGVTYFVTFRTADSVPQVLLDDWHRRRREWLLRNGIDLARDPWRAAFRTQPDLEAAYHRLFTRAMMEFLDQGFGRCVLAQPRLSAVVADGLRHFDGSRYYLCDFVVMPNHVHILLCLREATEIEALCKSWKRHSARRINTLLDCWGRFWQEESFDHLVRSRAQFERFRQYIAENPRRAGLRAGQYAYYTAP